MHKLHFLDAKLPLPSIGSTGPSIPLKSKMCFRETADALASTLEEVEAECRPARDVSTLLEALVGLRV